MKQILCFLLSFFCFQLAYGQWVLQQSGIRSEFRGLSAVNENVAWVSGSNNTYARTIDGGTTWKVQTIADTMQLGFRDVEAFSADGAYLLSIGPGVQSRIYKTVDDGGEHWAEIPQTKLPPGLPNEGGFAASGSCIVTQGKSNVWIGTSAGSRLYRSTDRGETWSVARTPLIKDTPASGIFSVAFYDAMNGIVAGGDYQKEGEARENIALTSDGGITWKPITDSKLGGFRSSVVYVPGTNGKYVVAVGPLGQFTQKMAGDTGHHTLRWDFMC